MSKFDTLQQSLDEQKELARLYRAYHFISIPSIIVICISGIALLIAKLSFPRGHCVRLMMDFLLLAVGIPLYFIERNKKSRWLRGLTEDDLALLKRNAETRDSGIMRGISATIDVSKPAREILKEYKKIEVNAEKELLRASTAASTDELLRPTTASPETPKDELLRATTKTDV